MKKGINWKKVLACVLVCVLTMALAAGCSPKKTEKPKKPEQNEEEVISEGETGENPAEDMTEMPAPPAEGEMSETEVDALGNPINDDGYYYDEDGNLVSEEDMMNVDEDGNPISEEDMLYSEGGDDGWDSVEYGDKEAFAEAVKTGYEEVTELPFEPTGTLYYLYANGVYETQYVENYPTLPRFSLGFSLFDNDYFVYAPTRGEWCFADCYEFCTFHKLTNWGHWLRMHEKTPTGNPCGQVERTPTSPFLTKSKKKLKFRQVFFRHELFRYLCISKSRPITIWNKTGTAT